MTEARISRARAAVIEIVDRAPPAPTLDDLGDFDTTSPPPPRSRLLLLLVVAGAVLVLVGGLVVLDRSNRDGGDRPTVPTHGTPSDTSPGSLEQPSAATGLAAVIGNDWRIGDGLHFRLNPIRIPSTGHYIVVDHDTCIVLGDYAIGGNTVRFSSADPSPGCPATATATGSWIQRMSTAGGEFTTTSEQSGGTIVQVRMADTGEILTLQRVRP